MDMASKLFTFTFTQTPMQPASHCQWLRHYLLGLSAVEWFVASVPKYPDSSATLCMTQFNMTLTCTGLA